MAKYTQQNRRLSVSTPLGNDALLLQSFSAEESISQLFSLQLGLLAESDKDVAFDAILGKDVTVTLVLSDKSERHFNGMVISFSQGEQTSTALGGGSLTTYHADVVPKAWVLTKTSRSRIFQQKSVPDILKQVLTGFPISFQLQGNYLSRDYCVQYRESDFDFASRLMEEEGIFYFFKHEKGQHQMVVADSPQSHTDVPSPSKLIYETVAGGVREEDRVQQWSKSQMLRSGKYRLWDSCFELPGRNLEAVKPTLDSVQVGTVSHKLKVGGNDQFEIYDFPGEYAQRFDGINPGGGDRSSDIQNIFKDNQRTVGLRMQEETAGALLIRGSSTCRQLSAGFKFSLDRHFNANGSYILTRVRHFATVGDSYTSGGDLSSPYDNDFDCIPASLPFRPTRTTQRPTIEGTQTAVVVGNQGDEIFTDKYGRIKVQFPWDREGKNNADSSCWIRVASAWAGTQWGMIHIPRVGQEVVIAFEEGDPDRPIVVGSVYNAKEMPPYTLPDNMTQSGLLSRTTKNGSPDNFNELRFEDKKGSEEIYFHAEKDFVRHVENNDSLKVGFDKKDKGDQTVEIFNNQSLTVGAGEGQASDGSQTISIWKDRTQTLKMGNETITIEQGNREATIKVGNDTLTIKMGDQTTKVELGSSKTEAMQSIEFKVGESSIKIGPTGITLKAMVISIEGEIQTEVKGLILQLSGEAMTTIEGGIIKIG